MAHKLGLKVIAEDVETGVQRTLLKSAACDYVQGYLFSRPVPPSSSKHCLYNNRLESRRLLAL